MFIYNFCFWVYFLCMFSVCESVYQEGGARNGEGLLVEIGATEEKQNVSSVFCLVELEQLSQFPQLYQVWGELQPERRDHNPDSIMNAGEQGPVWSGVDDDDGEMNYSIRVMVLISVWWWEDEWRVVPPQIVYICILTWM